jgi:hypothetical protein
LDFFEIRQLPFFQKMIHFIDEFLNVNVIGNVYGIKMKYFLKNQIFILKKHYILIESFE